MKISEAAKCCAERLTNDLQAVVYVDDSDRGEAEMMIQQAIDEATAEKDAEIDRLRSALESISIRCQEGDTRVDWLPIINDIAVKALAGGEAT